MAAYEYVIRYPGSVEYHNGQRNDDPLSWHSTTRSPVFYEKTEDTDTHFQQDNKIPPCDEIIFAKELAISEILAFHIYEMTKENMLEVRRGNANRESINIYKRKKTYGCVTAQLHLLNARRPHEECFNYRN